MKFVHKILNVIQKLGIKFELGYRLRLTALLRVLKSNFLLDF